VTAKTSLAPGDVLVNDLIASDWRTALVIAIDHGKLPTSRELNDGRTASVLLLVSGHGGETLIQRSFTWIGQQRWTRIDEF
jgi:hypothetical protein